MRKRRESWMDRDIIHRDKRQIKEKKLCWDSTLFLLLLLFIQSYYRDTINWNENKYTLLKICNIICFEFHFDSWRYFEWISRISSIRISSIIVINHLSTYYYNNTLNNRNLQSYRYKNPFPHTTRLISPIKKNSKSLNLISQNFLSALRDS